MLKNANLDEFNTRALIEPQPRKTARTVRKKGQSTCGGTEREPWSQYNRVRSLGPWGPKTSTKNNIITARYLFKLVATTSTLLRLLNYCAPFR